MISDGDHVAAGRNDPGVESAFDDFSQPLLDRQTALGVGPCSAHVRKIREFQVLRHPLGDPVASNNLDLRIDQGRVGASVQHRTDRVRLGVDQQGSGGGVDARREYQVQDCCTEDNGEHNERAEPAGSKDCQKMREIHD